MESEFQRMQREATERMLEMNARAKSGSPGSMPPAPDFVKLQGQQGRRTSARTGRQPPVAPPAPVKSPPAAAPAHSEQGGGFLSGIFSELSLDNDRILVLGLLFLLFRDKGDPLLMLALLYILL